MTVPPPPWRRAPRRRAAKPALSQELVVKTALEILAEEGFDAVTMRRVAQELETGPASLYAHVSNKDELAELMLDAVLGDLPLPAPDPARWDEQVKDLVRAQIHAMVAHPGIARVAWNIAVPVNPSALHQGEAMLALLRAGGLDLKQATFAGDALSLYAKAYAYEASGWTWGRSTPTTSPSAGSRCWLTCNRCRPTRSRTCCGWASSSAPRPPPSGWTSRSTCSWPA